MAKDLSCWLVTSDIDGTLNNKLRRLPKRNFDAIHRFVDELHGNFTLSSGRGIESMRPHYERIKAKMAPAVIMNGAGIYDFNKEELIYFNPLTEQGRTVVEKILRKFPTCEAEIVTPEMNYFVRPHWKSRIMLWGDKLPYKFCKNLSDVPFGRWGKVIFIDYSFHIRHLKKYVKSIETDKLSFLYSSICTYEMLAENTDKGSAVMKLAEIMGIDKTRTAAIGDYYNDYEMLRAVALPACCAQAPRDLKKISRLVTCHCNKGAVADLLEHIEKNS